MASADQLEFALRNADKAGDVNAAKILAAELARVRSQPEVATPERNLTLPANAGLANFGASTLGLPVDTVENALNLGIAAYGTAKQALTGKPGPDLLRGSFGGSQSIRNALRATGEPGLSPDNPTPNSTLGTLQYDLVSRGGFMPGGVVPAIGSIVAEKTLGPEYAGVGAMTPAAVGQAVSSARQALANSKAIRDNLATYRQAGVIPDVAQATESNFFRGLTNVVGRIPGGQGILAKFRELQQKSLGESAKTGVSAETAGRAIKEGITGDTGFLARTKEQWLKLDAQMAVKVPPDSRFTPTNTVKALDDLTATIQGAEKTTGALVNPGIAGIKENLAADLQANNGQIPFEALRSLRSKVGSMLDDSLVTGIPGGQLKQLYAGLSKDLETAANQAGAGREFTRQQNFYRARMGRIETTLDSILGKGKEPEAIFKSVSPTDADSVNKIRRVMRSLEPSERQTVSEAIVNRLGRATPGRQDFTGEKFSSDTFLTNWSKINESAKSQLFPDPAMRTKLNAIAKVASDIREGRVPFANPSGTAQGITATSIYGSPLVSLATGNVAPMAIAGSVVAGANIGAKMLTSPKVVDWLAQSTKATTPAQQAVQMARLSVIFNQSKDAQLKQELSDYITSLGSK